MEQEEGPDQPSIARIRDYWLDGSHNTEADREFADRIVVCAPHLPYLVRAQRALLGRMVRYLVEHGVRQFLDLGSGVPAVGHVHEVAQALDPACRVVYVDIDPGIEKESRSLLAGNDNTAFLRADICHPEEVFDAPELQKLLNFREPVAVLMIETLLHIPDSDNPAGVVATYADAMCSSSYLALAHFSENEQLLAAYGIFDRMMLGTRPEVHLRSREQLVGFFTGLELVEPGVVPVPLWNPATDEEPDRNPELVQMHVGLGRKP